MYGREIVAARQLLGTCFLLRDTTPIKDPQLLGKQPFREFIFWATHLFKSGAGSLLKVPPKKDSKTSVLV